MAYPVIEGYNTSNTASGTNHTVNLPANIQAGELLVVLSYSDGTNENDNIAGWTRLGYKSYSGHSCAILYKIATGEEGATVTGTTASTEATAHISLRISNWSDVELSAVANATSLYPNPPNLAPAWGVYKTLWLAIGGGDYNRTVSAYPEGYSDSIYSFYNGTGGCWVGCARKFSENESEDPGTFTISASDDWSAWTLAIAGISDKYYKEVLGNVNLIKKFVKEIYIKVGTG